MNAGWDYLFGYPFDESHLIISLPGQGNEEVEPERRWDGGDGEQRHQVEPGNSQRIILTAAADHRDMEIIMNGFGEERGLQVTSGLPGRRNKRPMMHRHTHSRTRSCKMSTRDKRSENE